MQARVSVAGWLAVLALAICWISAPVRAEDGAVTLAPMVLALTVNGVDGGEAFVVLADGNGRLWLEEADFPRLRLNLPAVAPREQDGRRYFPLAAIPGAIVKLDERQGQASVTVPPVAFSTYSRSVAAAAAPKVTPSPPGAFLNYQLYGQRGDYAGSANANATAELGVFSSLGVFTTTGTAVDSDAFKRAVRLETTFTHDFPSTLQTLRIGDAISTAGSWDGAVRFAGIQWGTNFALRPDLLTLPLLTVGGQATLPSTVDVFVNGHQVSSQQVPPGPFVVDRLPTVTGTGTVTLVVQDAQGRTQVVNVPFYSSATLLQAGLSSYSVELGAVRDNFTIASDDYGPGVAVATWRRGLTDSITIEGHAESETHGPRSAGVQYAERVGTLGVVDAELAGGGAYGRSGAYAGLGIEHVARPFSVAMRVQWAGSGFSDLAATPLNPLPRLRTLLQASYEMSRAGTLAFAAVDEKLPNDTSQKVFSLTHSLQVGHRGYLSLTATRTLSTTNGTSVYLIYTQALDHNRTASGTYRHDSTLPTQAGEFLATLQQNPPPGNGEGYRLSAASTGNYDADLLSQFNALALDVEAARNQGESAQRASVSGGLALISGTVRPLRQIVDSFALVDAGGVPGVTVYVENQPITKTDADGYALIPHLRAYERNRVSVDPTQLPLDVSLDSPQLLVVPAYRSGAYVRLPIARDHPGTLHLLQADGTPVPPGATVRLMGASFPVGFDGLAYITGYDHGMRGEAQWPGGHCAFRLPPPRSGEPVPDAGTLRCTASQR